MLWTFLKVVAIIDLLSLAIMLMLYVACRSSTRFRRRVFGDVPAVDHVAVRPAAMIAEPSVAKV